MEIKWASNSLKPTYSLFLSLKYKLMMLSMSRIHCSSQCPETCLTLNIFSTQSLMNRCVFLDFSFPSTPDPDNFRYGLHLKCSPKLQGLIGEPLGGDWLMGVCCWWWEVKAGGKGWVTGHGLGIYSHPPTQPPPYAYLHALCFLPDSPWIVFPLPCCHTCHTALEPADNGVKSL